MECCPVRSGAGNQLQDYVSYPILKIEEAFSNAKRIGKTRTEITYFSNITQENLTEDLITEVFTFVEKPYSNYFISIFKSK